MCRRVLGHPQIRIEAPGDAHDPGHLEELAGGHSDGGSHAILQLRATAAHLASGPAHLVVPVSIDRPGVLWHPGPPGGLNHRTGPVMLRTA